MSSFRIFDIAGSGMSAQSVRLNTVASNLANAESVSGDPAKVYRARHPVFQAIDTGNPDDIGASVKVQDVVREPGGAGQALRPRQSAGRRRRLSSMRPTSTPSRRWWT